MKSFFEYLSTSLNKKDIENLRTDFDEDSLKKSLFNNDDIQKIKQLKVLLEKTPIVITNKNYMNNQDKFYNTNVICLQYSDDWKSLPLYKSKEETISNINAILIGKLDLPSLFDKQIYISSFLLKGEKAHAVIDENCKDFKDKNGEYIPGFFDSIDSLIDAILKKSHDEFFSKL